MEIELPVAFFFIVVAVTVTFWFSGVACTPDATMDVSSTVYVIYPAELSDVQTAPLSAALSGWYLRSVLTCLPSPATRYTGIDELKLMSVRYSSPEPPDDVDPPVTT